MQYSLNCNVLLNETETLPSLEGGHFSWAWEEVFIPDTEPGPEHGDGPVGPFSWAWEAVFIPDTEPGPEHGDGPVGPQTETEVSLQLF